MRKHKKYFLIMLLVMSIAQPGCKHDHHVKSEKTGNCETYNR